MSSAKEIGDKIIELYMAGKSLEAIQTFYAEDAISLESVQGGGPSKKLKGRDKLLEKAKWWAENNTTHKAELRGPFPHGDNKFAIYFDMDLTNKEMGKRIRLEEVGIYHVSNGKVIQEEFYYNVD